MNRATIHARGVPIASMVPISRVRSNIDISSVLTLDMSTMKKTMMPMKQEDSVEHVAYLLVVGGQIDPLLQFHLLRQAAEPRRQLVVDAIGVRRRIQTDHQVGHAVALQAAAAPAASVMRR